MRLIVLIAVLVFISTNTEAIQNHLGCYKDHANNRALEQILFSDRPKNLETRIDWPNWDTYSCKLIERCAQAAKEKGYKYFGLEFYGECFGGNGDYSKNGETNWYVVNKYGDCAVGKARAICVYGVIETSSVLTTSSRAASSIIVDSSTSPVTTSSAVTTTSWAASTTIVDSSTSPVTTSSVVTTTSRVSSIIVDSSTSPATTSSVLNTSSRASSIIVDSLISPVIMSSAITTSSPAVFIITDNWGSSSSVTTSSPAVSSITSEVTTSSESCADKFGGESDCALSEDECQVIGGRPALLQWGCEEVCCIVQELK